MGFAGILVYLVLILVPLSVLIVAGVTVYIVRRRKED